MATLTNWTAVNDMGDLLNVANAQTGSWFWTAMNVMITLIILITLTTGTGSWIAGAMTALFIGMLIQVFMAYLGIGAWLTVGAYLGGLLGIIIYMMWSNKYD